MPAWDHGRHNDRTVDPPQGVCSGLDDVPADLVPKGERQIMLGSNAVVIIPQVGVANPTPGNFHDHFVRRWRKAIDFNLNEGLTLAHHHPTNWFNAHERNLQ